MLTAEPCYDCNRLTPEERGDIGKLILLLRLTGRIQFKTSDALTDRLCDNALTQADVASLKRKGKTVQAKCEVNMFQRQTEEEKQSFLGGSKLISAALRALEKLA